MTFLIGLSALTRKFFTKQCPCLLLPSIHWMWLFAMNFTPAIPYFISEVTVEPRISGHFGCQTICPDMQVIRIIEPMMNPWSPNVGHFFKTPGIQLFKIWPWKSKVKVITPGFMVGLTSYGLASLSFHDNWPSDSSNTAFSKFNHENLKSRSWERSKFKAMKCVPITIDSHPFRSVSTGPPIPVILLFQHLTLKMQGQGHQPMMWHNYRFRQYSIELWMV